MMVLNVAFEMGKKHGKYYTVSAWKWADNKIKHKRTSMVKSSEGRIGCSQQQIKQYLVSSNGAKRIRYQIRSAPFHSSPGENNRQVFWVLANTQLFTKLPYLLWILKNQSLPKLAIINSEHFIQLCIDSMI